MAEDLALSRHRLFTANPIMLVDFLEEMGFSRHEILVKTSINSELLKDAENQITCLQYRQLIDRALLLTGNSALGLEFGQRLNYTSAGLLSLGGMAAHTFSDALRFAAKTLEVLNPSVEFSLEYQDHHLRVELIERLPWGETESFMVETAYSIIAVSALLLDPTATENISYEFKYKPGKTKSYYRQFLTGKLSFEAEGNCLFIPLKICQKKLLSHNPTTLRQAETMLKKKILSIRDERIALVQPIKNMILGHEGESPLIEDVAKEFHMSSRTLTRRLKSVGTSYSSIITELRQELSRQLLSESSDSVDKIALQLGYRDSSNFSKAFKIWNGVTPTDFRGNSGIRH